MEAEFEIKKSSKRRGEKRKKREGGREAERKFTFSSVKNGV